MKKRFWIYKRGATYYLWDTEANKRESLQTSNKSQAEKILHAKLEASRNPILNLAVAKAYLATADPKLVERTWHEVMEVFCSKGKNSTRERRIRGVNSAEFNSIRHKQLITTTAEDFHKILSKGKVYTSHCLRCLHNLALGFGWLPWPILPPKLWPTLKHKIKRAITLEEHRRIIQIENNLERRMYYDLLWEIGAAQSDAATLTAKNIDWENRLLSYQRRKTEQWCHLKIGSTLSTLLKKMPDSGALFPSISKSLDKHRSAEFRRRCKTLRIEGISLHSYRYAWAERAKSCGYPERFALEALGHNSKAVHRAYAKHAKVELPSLDDYK